MMTRIEFLTRRWFEVDQLRYKKLAEIRSLTGDESWMRRRNIPGNALHAISEWIGLCRIACCRIKPQAAPRLEPRSRRSQDEGH